MSDPLLVEIIAYAPTAFYHCTHCEVAWRAAGGTNRGHDEQVRASLPADLASDYQAVSDWVREVFRVHCDRVVVRVVDVASLEGFVKALRYRVRAFPAVIVGQEARFTGKAQQVLEAARGEVDRRLGSRQAAQA